jgi:hypothetical protein
MTGDGAGRRVGWKDNLLQRSVKKRCSHEVGVLKVGIPHNRLLEGDTLEVLVGKVGLVQVDAARDGNRASAL